jgi:release factor glutamine methyltransferase
VPTFPPSLSEAAIVTTLRAAGCVFAEDEARLLVAETRTPAELTDMVERRVAGLPLEQILGWAEFCGLRIAVDPTVFVPRRRTEFLVKQAIGLTRPGAVVVDLCCGTGALGLALTTAVNAASTSGTKAGAAIELYAADIEHPAVECARGNIEPLGGQVFQGDLFEPLPRALQGRVETLLANVPYVPSDAIGLLPPEARDHEPRVTLDGGADGLEVLRRVAADARLWLAPGGHLLVETSERQAEQAVEIFAAAGLRARVSSSEELDATVIIGTRSPG